MNLFIITLLFQNRYRENVAVMIAICFLFIYFVLCTHGENSEVI